MRNEKQSNLQSENVAQKRRVSTACSNAFFMLYYALNFNQRHCKLVGEVEFRIILENVQNSFCIIVFWNNILCQRLLPEVLVFQVLATMKASYRNC